jgi:Cys-rich protein (TIGR01571 family)
VTYLLNIRVIESQDDLMACCGLGCCHPTLCMAWCCPIILLGQVMHRLKLTWTGREGGNSADTSSTFRIMFWIGMTFFAISLAQNVIQITFADENGVLDERATLAVLGLSILGWLFTLFYLVLMYKTRRYIREKYQIPEQQCHGCEDCCCVFWCACCTVAQIARHTGDYTNHDAKWCSETGLECSAPSIV